MHDNVRLLPLTPIEHVFTGPGSYAITFALAYDSRLDSARLQAGLGQALQAFWPLRSRLVVSSSHSYSFRCGNGDTVALEMADSADLSAESSNAGAYITPVTSIPGEPLTSVRLTETPAGSVLGVSISHALVDGFSFFHFLSSWARLAQGKRMLSPSHDRTSLLCARVDPEPGIDAADVLARCGLFYGGRRVGKKGASLDEEVVPISRQRLRGLKAEAQRHCQLALSDNDVLTAHAWKEYGAKWTCLEDDDTAYVTIPFDFRRLLREVPRTFFGCALSFATASMAHERLVSASLGEVASAVHESVAQVTGDYALGSLRALESLRLGRGLSAVQQVDVRHPTRGLVVTNISRLPIASADFGSGPPVELRAAMQADRAVAILPADDGVALRVFPPMGASDSDQLSGGGAGRSAELICGR